MTSGDCPDATDMGSGGNLVNGTFLWGGSDSGDHDAVKDWLKDKREHIWWGRDATS